MMTKNIGASRQILNLLPVIDYVSLGKLLNLPEAEFPYLKNGDNNGTCFIGLEIVPVWLITVPIKLCLY